MIINKIHKLIKEHEGLRLKPYRCTKGKLTIGWGHNLGNGITEDTAQFIFGEDLADCAADLESIFPGQLQKLPMDVQMVLMDMRFNLGHGGFRGFKKMIQAVKRSNLKEMIRQMKDSMWYRQVPGRAEDLIKMIKIFV